MKTFLFSLLFSSISVAQGLPPALIYNEGASLELANLDAQEKIEILYFLDGDLVRRKLKITFSRVDDRIQYSVFRIKAKSDELEEERREIPIFKEGNLAIKKEEVAKYAGLLRELRTSRMTISLQTSKYEIYYYRDGKRIGMETIDNPRGPLNAEIRIDNHYETLLRRHRMEYIKKKGA